MKYIIIQISTLILAFTLIVSNIYAQRETTLPDEIEFVRQGVRRYIFDDNHKIPLASLYPNEIIGMSAMYPTTFYSEHKPEITIDNNTLFVKSNMEAQASIWFGGFNAFATYTMELKSCEGKGDIGFEFSNDDKTERFIIAIEYNKKQIKDAKLIYIKDSKEVSNISILTNKAELEGKVILQMLGSGFTIYVQNNNLPIPIGQSDFASFVDLREKQYMRSLQSSIYLSIVEGSLVIGKVESALSSGMGLADIRAITYEDGSPLLDKDKLWYTMTIRGRALPHHTQGVFSLNPSTFDLKFEGIILFDRNDGLLRNEVASHIFYDRKEECWRGITTGFSAYAIPSEKKQLLAVESKSDPRFGFSIMNAKPMGVIGDYEDAHILFDTEANKWRMLVCENIDGYKAIMLESDMWNQNFNKIAGPVANNSTGTSIQKIGNKLYCFSGSQEREVYIYTYPDLKDAGKLKLNLPPWDKTSGTRIWPNVVQLPSDKYPFQYVALMMDRFNYPDLNGPNWTYGAIYLYHGYD